MTTPSTLRFPHLALAISLFLALLAPTLADTPIIRMARISLIEGEVSYRRANHDPTNWYDAAVNTSLGENDQVFTGLKSRTEIQLTGGNLVRLNGDTSFKITQFTTAVTQISLPLGTAHFRIDSLDRRQYDVVDANDSSPNDPVYFEINTPTVAVTLLKTGEYRITVQEDGTTEVIVRSGEAEVYNQELGNIALKKGRRIVVEGQDIGYYQIARLQDKDNFDRWNDQRDDELASQANSLSARYVPQGVPGVYDLDRYGDWWHTADYGYVWSPRSVAVGWAPYRVGYWHWYSDWGWTWISREPWGWAPYHYGRWAYYRSRWCWVPRGGLSIGFSWSPALVTFFGWGGNSYNRGYNQGYRQGYRDGRYDTFGWVPLAPGERYYNQYRGGRSTTIVNNTNIYGNGNTVINTRIDNYRNYNAPGGVTRMDGRRFETNRVVVNNTDTTPIQQPVIRSAVTARGDVMRPVVSSTAQPTVNPAADPTRRPTAQREVVTRGLTNRGETLTPSGERRGDVINGIPTFRNSDVNVRTTRPERVNPQNDNPSLNRGRVMTDNSRVTNRSGNVETAPRDRGNSDRPIDNDNRRVERNIERTPVERPTFPARRSEEPTGVDRTERTERPQRPFIWGGETNRGESTPPPATRRVETERREATPRRVESPRIERQEAPREIRREMPSPPAREMRSERPSAPPRMEAPRSSERPSSPPPQSDRGSRSERPSRRSPPDQ